MIDLDRKRSVRPVSTRVSTVSRSSAAPHRELTSFPRAETVQVFLDPGDSRFREDGQSVEYLSFKWLCAVIDGHAVALPIL